MKFSENCGRVQMRSDALGSQKRAKKRRKKRTNRSVSKMKDRIVTINSVQESSKSELSSRGKRPFKVFRFGLFFADTGIQIFKVADNSRVDPDPSNIEYLQHQIF